MMNVKKGILVVGVALIIILPLLHFWNLESTTDSHTPWFPNTAFDCGLLSNPEFGGVRHLGGMTTVGSIAVYACNSGFTLTGENTRRCVVGGWTGMEPICSSEFLYPAHFRIQCEWRQRIDEKSVNYWSHWISPSWCCPSPPSFPLPPLSILFPHLLFFFPHRGHVAHHMGGGG